MGMIGDLYAIGAQELEAAQHDTTLLDAVLYPDDGERETGHGVDLDKAWHGIHYLLTGSVADTDSPLGQAVMGGEEIGEDQGMGPARFLTPQQVKVVAAAVAAVSREQLVGRYDPAAMTAAGIYPDVIWERDGQESLDYLTSYFTDLAEFYRQATDRGDGAILMIA